MPSVLKRHAIFWKIDRCDEFIISMSFILHELSTASITTQTLLGNINKANIYTLETTKNYKREIRLKYVIGIHLQ